MESFVALLGIAVVLFAWTNLDDLLVLLGFFSDPRFRPRHVVIGQYVGIVVLYGVSVRFAALHRCTAGLYPPTGAGTNLRRGRKTPFALAAHGNRRG